MRIENSNKRQKARIDALIFERGLAESRERAKAVIMSGSVYAGGKKITKPGERVADDETIEVREGLAYVSRGGLKLEKALSYFGVSPEGKVCVDCGASTGGFTDCLLKNGARLVYAVDVGYGQLAWSLRNDPRVVTMERTNIRYVNADMFGEKPELAVIDVSFISLALVLPVINSLLREDGEVLCLIKPQFEAGRGSVGKKGVVRDPETHVTVLETFAKNARTAGFSSEGFTYSPVKGPEGNIEFLGKLRKQGTIGREETQEAVGVQERTGKDEAVDIAEVVSQAHRELAGQVNGQ